jgi:folate-binding protein YgfZ
MTRARLCRAMLLRDAHVTLGGRVGDAGGFQAVLDYAPLDREVPLLQQVGIADWGFHGALAVRGSEAGKFLQNILSSDVGALREGFAQPSLLLSAKGKVIGAFRIWRHERDHYDLLVEAPCFGAARDALARYAKVGKVEFEDRSRELGLVLVQGPEAAAVVREAVPCEPPGRGHVVETPAGNVLAHESLASAPGYLLLVRQEQAREAWERLVEAAKKRGGGPVGFFAVDAERVRAGVPRFGAECTPESLPGEAGLDAAISYAKGCFVGQEVVARIKNLGHVNHLAVRLAPEGPCDVGEPLSAEGKEAGHVTSVARGPGSPAALASVRREAAQVGASLTLPRGTATIAALAQL